MKHTIKKNIYALCAVLFLLMLDQATKIWAAYMLKHQPDMKLLPDILHLHYLENTGAAFSILEDCTWFFVILTSILILILIYILQRLSSHPEFWILRALLVVLISGAAGNLLDRIANGYVIDFIYFVPVNFPVFNVADIYVTVSIFALAFLLLFYYKEEDIEHLAVILKIRSGSKEKNGN